VTVNPNDFVDAQLAGLSVDGMGAPGLPDPIGGYAAPQEIARLTSGERRPVYREGDQLPLLSNMPVESLARLQQTLMALGLASNVIVGEVDDGTARAFSQVLSIANRRGERWSDTINRLRVQVEQSGQGLGPVEDADVYLAPDYASIAQQVKALFKQRLRRDPTDAELALLGDEMSALFRKQFDVSQGAQQQAKGAGAGRVIEAMDVDPVARFQEAFEKRYAGELEVVENIDRRQEGNQTSRMVMDSLGSLIGGMG
jgi:hypothetical protein